MASLIVTVLTCFLALASQADAAGAWRFQTVDAPCPGCTGLQVFGLTPQGTRLGAYTDAAARRHGFLWPRQGDFQPLLLLTPTGMNLAGALVGALPGASGQREGFRYEEGTLYRVQVQGVPEVPAGRRAVSTLPLAINDIGQIGGEFRAVVDGPDRGFVYDPATNVFTSIAPPGAGQTRITALDHTGRALGVTLDATDTLRNFLWVQGVVTFVDIPGRPRAWLNGMTADGRFSGNDDREAFVVDGTEVEVIAVPGALVTVVHGIRDDGTVYGWYGNPPPALTHGFIATPTGGRGRPKR